MFVALLKSRVGPALPRGAWRALDRALHSRRWRLVEVTSPVGYDLRGAPPGIILVESGAPGDGLDRVRALREAWPDVAIVLVGDVGGPLEVVAALDAGADDVVHSDMMEVELVARIVRFGPRPERRSAGLMCPSVRLRHTRSLGVRRSQFARKWRGV